MREKSGLFWPAGVCNVCHRKCMTLDQVGIRCYHPECGKGVYLGRTHWKHAPCPVCKKSNPFCRNCHGYGNLSIQVDPVTQAPILTPP